MGPVKKIDERSANEILFTSPARERILFIGRQRRCPAGEMIFGKHQWIAARMHSFGTGLYDIHFTAVAIFSPFDIHWLFVMFFNCQSPDGLLTDLLVCQHKRVPFFLRCIGDWFGGRLAPVIRKASTAKAGYCYTHCRAAFSNDA